jgi:hypothetical protein
MSDACVDRMALAIALLCAAVFSLGCSSTADRVNGIHGGETKQEVLDRLGPPPPSSELPLGVADPPKGCASHLVYRDQYDSTTLRWFADRVQSCGGTWLHVCFDEDGRALSGLRFSMIQC